MTYETKKTKQKFYVKIIEQYEVLNEKYGTTKTKTISSYHVQEKDIKEIENFLINSNMKKSSKCTKKAVRCIETNMIFDSKIHAGIWLQKNNIVEFAPNALNSIRAVCNGKKNTAYGYHWEYVN